MSGQGFHEAQVGFENRDARAFVGEVRRFGSMGPAYEVLDTTAACDLMIEVIESGERLDYAVIHFLADPMATTVP